MKIRILCVLAFVATSLAQEAEPVITMRRTACYGSCPVYSLKVYADGRVVYEGNKNVATSGTRIERLPISQVQKLIDTFLNLDFVSLKDRYTAKENPDGTFEMITDQPTTYVSLTLDGRTKTVEDYYGAPDALHVLESEIDRVVDSHQWLHDKQHRITDLMILESDVWTGHKHGMTPLFRAAGLGHTADLQREIASGADVNATDDTGWTPLMVAAALCHDDAISILVQKGANSSAQDQNGDNALIAAAASYRCDKEDEKHPFALIRTLLKAGASLNAQNLEGETALIAAVKAGNLQAVKMLLKAGADRNLKDKRGETALAHSQQREQENVESYYHDDAVRIFLMLSKSSTQ